MSCALEPPLSPPLCRQLANIKSSTSTTALIIAINEKNADVVDLLIQLLDAEALKQRYREKEPLK